MSDRADTPQPSLYGDADPQRKLSLLKKAVISLTKQKQELEATNAALTEKLTQLGETLGEAHDTENQLRRELASMSNELQSFKALAATNHASLGGRVGAGVASIKGLFGNVAGDGGGGSATTSPSTRAAPHSSGSKPTQGPGGNVGASLSQEGQERMFEENESLHMQLFELRTGHAAAIKAAEEARRQLEAKVAALEVDNRRHAERQSEQTKELTTVYGELDGLRASDLFCKTFLCIDTVGDAQTQEGHQDATPKRDASVVVRPVRMLAKAEIAPSLSHAASWRINRLQDAAEQLASAVGAAVVAVKGMWHDREVGGHHSSRGGVSHEVRQLRTLQTLFAAKTMDLMRHLKTLTDMCVREAADHTHFTHVELSVLHAAEECAAALLPFAAILVEGSIPLGARTSQYPLPLSLLRRGDGGGGNQRDPMDSTASTTVPVSRDVAVDALVDALVRAISGSRATLSLLQSLVAKRQSRNAVPSHVPSWSCMWLDSLLVSNQLVGWAGTMGVVMAAWGQLVVDSRLKRCLETISEQLTNMLPVAPTVVTDRKVDQCHAAPMSSPLAVEPNVDHRGHPSAYAALLATADRACLQYYTQCQHALLELADKNTAYETVLGQQRLLQRKVADHEEEVKTMRDAYELQIRLLSDQLTVTDHDDAATEERREDGVANRPSSSSGRGVP